MNHAEPEEINVKTVSRNHPWLDWPAIKQTAQENGWSLLAERYSVARMERRDTRSETAAATLHVAFDAEGRIANAWIAELDRQVEVNNAEKLPTILDWLREALGDTNQRCERLSRHSAPQGKPLGRS